MLTDDQRVSPTPLPPIFMDCLGSPGEEEDARINDNTVFTINWQLRNQSRTRFVLWSVKNCHTPWNLCCAAISIYDPLIEHIFWARPYARQMERSTHFPQGNLSLVGRQTNEQRTEAPQEGFSSEVRAKGKMQRRGGWVCLKLEEGW